MPRTAGTACLRRDAGGAQSSVQRFRADSTAWASATAWRPPPDAAVTLSLEGVSSLLRCPQQRPAQFHVLPGCLRTAEARAIHEDASATHDSRQAQMALVLRRRTAETAAKDLQRQRMHRRGRAGRGAPPASPPSRARPSPQSMRTIDSSLLSQYSRTLLWGAVHQCLLPFARHAFPGLPGRWGNASLALALILKACDSGPDPDPLTLNLTLTLTLIPTLTLTLTLIRWDNLSHFLGVRMHTPQLSDETDRLHVDSTLFTAVCTP